jgi:SAM-dependent methyltransferase
MQRHAGFSDHFSPGAAEYERRRPGYPQELFEFLAAVAPGRRLAVDVATGNGQAATGLAGFFDEVLATEPSEAQLARARPHPRVHYRREQAERIGLPDGCCELLTAAQAAHWFDWNRFPQEALRVLVPGGVVAVWTYELFSVEPAIDAIVEDFYRNVTGPYWPRERHHVEERYASLPFAFEEFPVPAFCFELDWTAADAVAYLGTWSAVLRRRAARGDDPLALVMPRLARAWGDGMRRVIWPIHLRAGRTPSGMARSGHAHQLRSGDR